VARSGLLAAAALLDESSGLLTIFSVDGFTASLVFTPFTASFSFSLEAFSFLAISAGDSRGEAGSFGASGVFKGLGRGDSDTQGALGFDDSDTLVALGFGNSDTLDVLGLEVSEKLVVLTRDVSETDLVVGFLDEFDVRADFGVFESAGRGPLGVFESKGRSFCSSRMIPLNSLLGRENSFFSRLNGMCSSLSSTAARSYIVLSLDQMC